MVLTSRNPSRSPAKIRKKADKGDAMAWVHTDSPALISWGALSARGAGPQASGTPILCTGPG